MKFSSCSNQTRKLRFTVYALAAVTSVTASSMSETDLHDLPLQQALARSIAGPDYVYEVRYESTKMNAQYSVDPTQPKGARVTVSTPSRDQWSLEFIGQIAEMDESADTNFLCSDFASNIPAAVTLVRDTELTATYEFEPRPEDEDDAEVFPWLTGYVTVDKIDPGILSFEMISPQPFSPHWFLKISSLQMKVDCGRLPDGRTHVQQLTSTVEGSAASISISNREFWEIVDYHQIMN